MAIPNMHGAPSNAMDRLVADALSFADQLGWTTFHLIAHDWAAWCLDADGRASATPHPVALSTEAAAEG